MCPVCSRYLRGYSFMQLRTPLIWVGGWFLALESTDLQSGFKYDKESRERDVYLAAPDWPPCELFQAQSRCCTAGSGRAADGAGGGGGGGLVGHLSS